jgi:multiple sugar transport system permease protein
MKAERDIPASTPAEVSTVIPAPAAGRLHVLASRAERLASAIFIWPAVLVVLFLSIFPFIISVYLSLARLQFVRGGFDIKFVGLLNYRKLLFGSEQEHFLGKLAQPSLAGWVVLAGIAALLLYGLFRSIRSPRATASGVFWRAVGALGAGLLAWLTVRALSAGGRPGTLVVTLVYVAVGIVFQYLIGLGLALLCVQQLPGRRFFRILFLLPMMITPVGVAYMFRMLTDTGKGPFKPIWVALGLENFSWVNDPWGARAAIIIGDIWQWTPFMFIVLLATLEAQSVEPIEAALVDGASGWQIFRHITLPAILPASTTLILIRLIEAFKIVDLPRVMTNGGPGTATESLTLHAVIAWRSLDLGGSAAIAFLLLILVTFCAIAFVNLVRQRTTEAV